MSHVEGGAMVCILALRVSRVIPVAFSAVWGEVAMCPPFRLCFVSVSRCPNLSHYLGI